MKALPAHKKWARPDSALPSPYATMPSFVRWKKIPAHSVTKSSKAPNGMKEGTKIRMLVNQLDHAGAGAGAPPWLLADRGKKMNRLGGFRKFEEQGLQKNHRNDEPNHPTGDAQRP